MYDRTNLKKLGKLGAAAPSPWQGFLAWDKAVMADGALSKKHKELIAVAVALATQCPYCIDVHSAAARKEGASEAELAEAAFVAAAIKAGGALTHATHFIED
ncbi:MAG: alkylhydroperoxidase [Sphingobium sp.]|nr:alkylhydroperoxidase [Sphingobium sp.]